MEKKQKKSKRLLRFAISKKSQKEIENIPLKGLIYFSVILNISSVVFVLIIKNHLPPVVPLYYGLAKSEGQLASQTQLLIPNIASFMILATNILVSLITDNDFIEKILVVSAFAVSILSTITVIKIVFLVGSF